MDARERLEKLRRMKELKMKAAGQYPSVAPPRSAWQAYKEEVLSPNIIDPALRTFLGGEMPLDEMMKPKDYTTMEEPGIEEAFVAPVLGAGYLGGKTALTAGRNLARVRGRGVKSQWLQDLVTPYGGRKQQIRQELRGTDKTPLGTYKFRLSNEEAEQAKVLETVRGLQRSGNYRDHINVMNAEINYSSTMLKKRLRDSNKIVSESEVESGIRKQLAEYMNTLEGSMFNANPDEVDNYVNIILAEYRKHPQTPAGLWEARKSVDNMFQNLAGTRRYNSVVGNVEMIPTKQEIMFDQARRGMLNVMEGKVPGSRKEMRRLSLLYDARQTMAEKAPDVGVTALQRGKKATIGDRNISLKPRNWINR